MRLLGYIDFPQTREVIRVAQKIVRGIVIRVAVRMHRTDQNSWTQFANEVRNYCLHRTNVCQASVIQFRVYALGHAQDRRGRLRLRVSFFNCSTRAQFALGEIENRHAAPLFDQFRNDTANAHLHIVGVRAHCQHVTW